MVQITSNTIISVVYWTRTLGHTYPNIILDQLQLVPLYLVSVERGGHLQLVPAAASLRLFLRFSLVHSRVERKTTQEFQASVHVPLKPSSRTTRTCCHIQTQSLICLRFTRRGRSSDQCRSARHATLLRSTVNVTGWVLSIFSVTDWFSFKTDWLILN
jgi:hypothetical protein